MTVWHLRITGTRLCLQRPASNPRWAEGCITENRREDSHAQDDDLTLSARHSPVVGRRRTGRAWQARERAAVVEWRPGGGRARRVSERASRREP